MWSRALGAAPALAASIWLLGATSRPESQGSVAAAEVTFAADVAPILHASCASCHRPGGPGPFSLLTYDDAVRVAPRIARAIESGRMPPWLPAPGDVAFEGDRTLPDAARATLVEWARSDDHAPGDLSTVRTPTFVSEWHLGEPDVIARTPEPYPAPADGDDVFRNLVITPELDGRVWVRGLELRFEDASAVHHAMITFDVTNSSRRMDARDEAPGFDGMFASTEALGPSGFLLGWTPGHEPALSPADLAFPLDPGTDIVLQLHLRPTGEPVDVRARVGIYTTPEPPDRTPFTVRLGVQTIDIAPGVAAYTLTDSYQLPVDISILGLYPHAHFIGKSIDLIATRPDSTRITVLDIPDWDFNWQDAYRLAEPLRLPAGTRLDARFVYDNTAENPRNPSDPPKRVVYGPRSEDEMGEIWIQVLPARESDHATLAQDFARYDLRGKIEGWRHTLEIDPGDPPALTGLGTLEQARGRHDAAIPMFRRALEGRPDYVVARYNLALSLESLGRVQEARQEYARVVEDDPLYAAAHNNLGLIYARADRVPEALAAFGRAVETDPSNIEALSNLGNALRQTGDLAGAAERLENALSLQPGHRPARLNLALVAWTLATHRDAAIRDGAEAVRLARIVNEGIQPDPQLLDVLAAAYAEAGDFERAVETCERALALANAAGPEAAQLAATIEARLDLYRTGVPYRSS